MPAAHPAPPAPAQPSPTRQLRRYPLAEQAADALLARVRSGDWPVGARLPGETTLAGELGVGRSTVREAVRSLAGRGVLESRQGSGVYVLAVDPAEDWAAVLRTGHISDVLEGRRALDVEAARLAAERRTDTDLDALDAALVGRGDAELADDAAFVDADLAFHGAVVTAAHNPVVADLYATFAPRVREAMIDMLDVFGGLPGRPTDHDAHAEIVAAIRDRDADRAAAVARAHLTDLLTSITATQG